MSAAVATRPGLALKLKSLQPLHARMPWLLASFAVALLCWPGLQSLFQVWADDAAYAHGAPLLLASFALLLREPPLGRRKPIQALTIALPLALLAMAWAAAHRAGLVTISTSLLPLVWLLMVWSTARGGLHTLLAPALLLLAVPGWNIFVPALQGLTIVTTEWLLSLIGITALVEGDTVQLPGGRFVIEGGCSGLRFILAALTTIGVFGLWRRQPLPRLGRWLLLTALFAVALNQLRVFAIVLVGHVSEMQHSLVSDHEWFGWGLFLLLFTPFVIRYLRRDEADERPVDIALVRRLKTDALTLALLIAVLSLTIGSATVLLAAPVHRPLPPLPASAGEWQRQDAATRWRAGFSGAQRELRSAYVRVSEQVDVHVAGFDRVSGDGGLLAEGNGVADELRWRRQAGEASVMFDHYDWPLDAAVLVDASGRQRLVLWWYQVDAQRHNSGLRARLASWRAVAFGGAPGGTLLAFSSACQPDCGYAAERIDALLMALALADG